MRPHLRPTGSRPGQAQQPPGRHERAGGGRGGAARSPPAAAGRGRGTSRGERCPRLPALPAPPPGSGRRSLCIAMAMPGELRAARPPRSLGTARAAGGGPAPGSRPQAGPRRPRGGRCPARSPRQEMRPPARNVGGGWGESQALTAPPASARPLPAPPQHQEPSQLRLPPQHQPPPSTPRRSCNAGRGCGHRAEISQRPQIAVSIGACLH